jgi:ribonuclease VapC
VTVVLDASAVLAYLKRGPGFEAVRAALADGAVVSIVNLAEVYGKVVDSGQPLDAVAARLAALGLESEPFTDEDARRSAEILPLTRPRGLSLGDRACLALALRLGTPALTTERTWLEVATGAEVRTIR